MVDDEVIMKAYNRGWDECFYNIDHAHEYEGIEKTAYNLGWQYYIIGDDVTSIDALTDKELLERIKKIHDGK